MKQVVLGKSGVTAPAIGVGCMRIDKMEESALYRLSLIHISVAFPAHTLLNSFLTKHTLVLFMLVLPTLVGMED